MLLQGHSLLRRLLGPLHGQFNPLTGVDALKRSSIVRYLKKFITALLQASTACKRHYSVAKELLHTVEF